MRSRLGAIATLVALLAPACTPQPTFRDAPVVWRAEDRQDIPRPEEREYYALPYFADILAMRALTRAMELPDSDPAGDTNALDEVPDSTWFTNRIGARDLTPEEVAVGPARGGPPTLPLLITSGKTGGGNPGFVVEDADGRVFLLKFDTMQNPEMQTSASVIVNRLLWAAGYNVPSDTILVFERHQLRLAPDATTDDELGRERRLTAADVEEILATSPRRPDGSFRASASEFLEGVPVGGFAPEGRRADDPNDRVAHEDRRTLRGLRALAAWLNHTDMKEDNTLDMWVEDGDARYLVHYLLDFGEALGSHQAEKNRLDDGYEHVWDWGAAARGLVTFGLWRRTWEAQEQTPWPSIGAFSGEHFVPEEWSEAYPYWPFREATAEDLYWGAKLVMRFDRPIVEAVVAEARFSHPGAAEAVVEALMERRRRIGMAWIEGVSPLDAFEVDGDALCGLDLGVFYGLAGDGVVERLPEDYRREFDDGDPAWERGVVTTAVDLEGRFCLPLLPGDERGYAVDRLRTRRGPELHPTMQVHYLRDEQGGARVVGIIRIED